MERYTLKYLYGDTPTLFNNALKTNATSLGITMGVTASTFNDVMLFVGSAIYGYFYDDLVAYTGEDTDEVKQNFMNRLSYDVAVKLPYWYKKYNMIKKLLTTEDLSLLQTSKVTSSSSDDTKSASGSLQKTATTPTGVSSEGSTDTITISKTASLLDENITNIETNGFADKYTNAQQKYANSSQVKGTRSGEILREGSIDELLNVLEKLPSSFADEVTKAVGKHFIFDYDGESKGYYNEN